MEALEKKKPNGSDLVLTSPHMPAVTPMQLLEMAMSQNADLDKLKQLMDLQERWEKNEARKAFVESMNAFKLNPPSIVKDHLVSFGQGDRKTEYKHATLANVVRAVTESLSAVGISHRWTVKQDPQWITVTCVLTHKMGHSEETALMGAADNSGAKNPIQAIGSTVTYLQRYTLLSACGLAAGEDGDGRIEAADPITNGNVSERIEFLQNCTDFAELKKLFATYYKEFANSKSAQKAIQEAYEAQKRKLNHDNR